MNGVAGEEIALRRVEPVFAVCVWFPNARLTALARQAVRDGRPPGATGLDELRVAGLPARTGATGVPHPAP
jgi:hypothetical protein